MASRSKNHISKFHQIFCTLPVVVARSSSDNSAMLCASDYVDNVMFSHNGANGPKSSTMLSSSPGGSTEGEVRRLRLHLVGILSPKQSPMESATQTECCHLPPSCHHWYHWLQQNIKRKSTWIALLEKRC